MDFPFKFPSRKDGKRLLSHQILYFSPTELWPLSHIKDNFNREE